MDSITIKVPVTVKAKLTEKLKARMIDERKKSIETANLELSQMDKNENQALSQHGQGDVQRVQEIRQYFNMERHKRLELKASAQQSIEEIEKLGIGAEIVQGQIERVIEAKVGDNFRTLANAEILIEDDKIIAIRE